MQEEGWRKSPSKNYAAEAKAQLCLWYADLLIFWGTCRQAWMPHAGLPVSNCPRGTQFQLTIMEYMNRMRKSRKHIEHGVDMNLTAHMLATRIPGRTFDLSHLTQETRSPRPLKVSDSNPPCHWKKAIKFIKLFRKKGDVLCLVHVNPITAWAVGSA